MLKTVSSENSLVYWDKNQNKSNIFVSALGGDKLFLKPLYVKFFSEMAEELKKKPTVFVKLWSKMCDEARREVENAIRLKVQTSGTPVSPEALAVVSAKFRGNVGEIMVEALVNAGIINLGTPGTYAPVDPTNERFIDATIEKDGLPIGIQIKNYTVHELVGQEVLTKAEAMDSHWLRVEKRIPRDKVLEFLESPSQYVLSLSNAKNDLIVEDVKNAVVFLGPAWFDNLKIQGSSKTGESPRWKVFQQIADEISALS